VRNVSHHWIFAIREKLESAEDEVTRAGLQQRLFMLAATCFSTFDVCPKYRAAVLASDEDFSIAMQCAILVHDNTPPSLSNDNSFYLTRTLNRHRRLLHDLEPVFCQLDSTKPDQPRLLHACGYDHALSRLWFGFRGTSSWHVLPTPNSRWINCETKGGQQVHYDLLTGQLLVDGKQLGRLPQKIAGHITYISILGAVSSRINLILPFSRFPKVFSENSRCSSG
jgi:hypothetical protein